MIKFISCALSLILPIIAGELIARMLIPSHSLNVRIISHRDITEKAHIYSVMDSSGPHGVRLVPNQTSLIKDHFLSHKDVLIESNMMGLRGPELGEKQKGETRLLVLGDSITFQDYLPFDETWTVMLGKKLGPNVTVINAGLPGASLSDEFYHFTEIRDGVQPDVILIGLYLNDAQNSEAFYAKPRRWYESVLWRLLIQNFVTPQSQGLVWTVPPPAFTEGAEYDWGLGWNYDAWNKILNALQAFKTWGTPVEVMLFPVRYQAEGKIDDLPQQYFANTCTAAQLRCLDLLPSLKANYREGLFYDHCHPTQAGNEIIVNAVVPWLQGKEATK